jgi:hypothetical protein
VIAASQSIAAIGVPSAKLVSSQMKAAKSGRARKALSAYELACRAGYGLTCRGGQAARLCSWLEGRASRSYGGIGRAVQAVALLMVVSTAARRFLSR